MTNDFYTHNGVAEIRQTLAELRDKYVYLRVVGDADPEPYKGVVTHLGQSSVRITDESEAVPAVPATRLTEGREAMPALRAISTIRLDQIQSVTEVQVIDETDQDDDDRDRDSDGGEAPEGMPLGVVPEDHPALAEAGVGPDPAAGTD